MNHRPSQWLWWSIPFSALLHNLKEYPRVVAYAQRHGLAIRQWPMGIAVALATFIPFLLTGTMSRWQRVRRLRQLTLALLALMALNGATHLAQTSLLRDYSPGTITCIGLKSVPK